jgi:hypothetical protein
MKRVIPILCSHRFPSTFCATSSSSNGKLKLNVAPLPFVLLDPEILPPWASTMLFDINKPSPVPDEEFVTNFENNFDSTLG